MALTSIPSLRSSNQNGSLTLSDCTILSRPIRKAHLPREALRRCDAFIFCHAFALGLLHRVCSGRAFRVHIYRHDHKVHVNLSSGHGETTLSASSQPEPLSCSITPGTKESRSLILQIPWRALNPSVRSLSPSVSPRVPSARYSPGIHVATYRLRDAFSITFTCGCV